MKAECIGSTICTAVAGTSTALQPNEVMQYIQIGITIIAGLISIILGIRAWWKDAKKDGKITKDEIDELGHIVGDGVKDIKEQVDSAQESQKGEK